MKIVYIEPIPGDSRYSHIVEKSSYNHDRDIRYDLKTDGLRLRFCVFLQKQVQEQTREKVMIVFKYVKYSDAVVNSFMRLSESGK